MRSMIVVAMMAVACVNGQQGWAGPPANIALSQDGRNILDTPEVAQARAAHLAALSQASKNNPNPNDDGSYNPQWDNEEYWQRAEQPKWNAAPAAPQWNAAPAASQWNAAPAAPQWNAAPSAPAWNAAPAPSWNAAPAPAWNPALPAPVAETPEVAQARASHLAALAAAKSAAPAPAPAHQQWNAAPVHQQWNAAPSHQQWNAAPAPAPQWNAAPAHQQQWNGAPSWQSQPAQIRLSHDGSQVLETPEVAAARAAHLAAHAQAAQSAPPAQPQHQQRW